MKIRNVSGEDRIVPALGGRLVSKDQVVDVPAGEVHGFTSQPANWEPADADAQAEHDGATAALNPQPEPEKPAKKSARGRKED